MKFDIVSWLRWIQFKLRLGSSTSTATYMCSSSILELDACFSIELNNVTSYDRIAIPSLTYDTTMSCSFYMIPLNQRAAANACFSITNHFDSSTVACWIAFSHTIEWLLMISTPMPPICISFRATKASTRSLMVRQEFLQSMKTLWSTIGWLLGPCKNKPAREQETRALSWKMKMFWEVCLAMTPPQGKWWN